MENPNPSSAYLRGSKVLICTSDGLEGFKFHFFSGYSSFIVYGFVSLHAKSHQHQLLTVITVVALFQGSVFSEKVQSLQLFYNKFSSCNQLLNFFRIFHIFIFQESCFQTASKVVCSFGILPSKVQQLEGKKKKLFFFNKLSVQ